MAQVENTTENLKLPLPNSQNFLSFDVGRLISALQALDAVSLFKDDGSFVTSNSQKVITATFTVPNESAITSAATDNAKKGDIAHVTSDLYRGESYWMLFGEDRTKVGNWIEISTRAKFTTVATASALSGIKAKNGDLASVTDESNACYIYISDLDEWIPVGGSSGLTVFVGTDLASVIAQSDIVKAKPGDVAKTTDSGNFILLATPGSTAENWFNVMGRDEGVLLRPNDTQTISSKKGLAFVTRDETGTGWRGITFFRGGFTATGNGNPGMFLTNPGSNNYSNINIDFYKATNQLKLSCVYNSGQNGAEDVVCSITMDPVNGIVLKGKITADDEIVSKTDVSVIIPS